MTSVKQRMRVTMRVQAEYDIIPGDYGTSDPREMARIDEANFKADPEFLLEYHTVNVLSVDAEVLP